jgi:hypothetical protein
MSDALPPAAATTPEQSGPDECYSIVGPKGLLGTFGSPGRIWMTADKAHADRVLRDHCRRQPDEAFGLVVIGVHPSHCERADAAERERDEWRATATRLAGLGADMLGMAGDTESALSATRAEIASAHKMFDSYGYIRDSEDADSDLLEHRVMMVADAENHARRERDEAVEALSAARAEIASLKDELVKRSVT